MGPAALLLVPVVLYLDDVLIFHALADAVHAFVAKAIRVPTSVLHEVVWVSLQLSSVGIFDSLEVAQRIFHAGLDKRLHNIQLDRWLLVRCKV